MLPSLGSRHERGKSHRGLLHERKALGVRRPLRYIGSAAASFAIVCGFYFAAYFAAVRPGLADMQNGAWACGPTYLEQPLIEATVVHRLFGAAHFVDRRFVRPGLWSGNYSGAEIMEMIARDLGLLPPASSTPF